MLVLPLAVFCSFGLGALFRRSTLVYPLLALVIGAASIVNYLPVPANTPTGIADSERQQVIDLIMSRTSVNDRIVTDEGVFSSLSGRLPPPLLCDLSFVRILSGNLSPEMFQKSINEYKPVLIIPWNGRMRALRGFDSMLQDYKVLTTINGKEIYIRSDRLSSLLLQR
jgi:hypothetical protein